MDLRSMAKPGSLVVILLASGCSTSKVPTTQSGGVTIKVTEACTDGSSTFIQLETAVTQEEWQSASSQFPNPESVFFETAITLMQDGELFSPTSSGSRSGPILDEQGRFTSISQEFRFPGSPSPATPMSIDAEVSYSDMFEAIAVPGSFHIEFTVDECR